ncbi:putative glycoside hydrolase [Sulfurimonas sp. SAG-AH-194-C21]|nr:putative glycoside hydrolase [Sulfurimonas sp. SAG-AH-194-C21]MDF1883787.1 putative glycoside hydrolase [Sulfurimonas sp. SAG-AH-194-C21]
MKKLFSTLLFLPIIAFASFDVKIIDAKTLQPISGAIIYNKKQKIKSDAKGLFSLEEQESLFHVKVHGYRPFSFKASTQSILLKLKPIKVKALYLSFWGASNNSQTLKNLLQIIKKTEANAVVVDVKNEYGSTSFLTSFKQANSYGAHKDRTNRNIQKFIQTMRDNNIYTIARIVTFKDEIQASHNPEYAIKRDDNGSIWRNHDNMAWVDPFDKRSHDYTIAIAEEAAKVGFDEINFDYIRFPAKSHLRYSKQNTKKNRIKAIEIFLDSATKKLHPYGIFISVNAYGNILWGPKDDDNNIGQTLESLASHSDYIAPMLYPSGFASGSFFYKYPADYPYSVIYRSLNNIKDRVDIKRVRPWLQYFRDYKSKKRPYKKFEIQEQIRPIKQLNANGWMMWSPSSKYHIEYLLP